MKTIILLAFGLFCVSAVQAQVGSSISSDGTAPNDNAMLDVQSPSTGAGKGMLIPRVTQAQRTTANAVLDGGLLDNSGNLRGGAAQGLIVYQTDGAQGLYFNTSQTATPAWVHLGEGSDLDMQGHVITNATYYGDGHGITNLSASAFTETDPRWAAASNAIVADIATRLSSNVWAAAGSSTNYLPRTGGTMSGALNMDGQMVTNVAHIDFNGNDVSVGRGANGSASGVAIGYQANGSDYGVAVGRSANGSSNSVAIGRSANSYYDGVAVGYTADGTVTGTAVGASANGNDYGAAIGKSANGYYSGAAVGVSADGSTDGAAMGCQAYGSLDGAALGRSANAYNRGVAVGRSANGYNRGVAVGREANGYYYGTVLGYSAVATNYGVAIGYQANGSFTGAAVGASANGVDYGAAIGRQADGHYHGAAMGWQADGSHDGAAVGYQAKGSGNGAAMGYGANGVSGVAVGQAANGNYGNVAIGVGANAQGSQSIAIGYEVTNSIAGTASIRGHLYLDGGTGIWYRANFGSGDPWTAKAFTIDHPLDPENKVLRHFCLEGPQVWNVYAGNAQLVNGQAVVQLPDYYSALNLVGSEICSLTPWGRANVWVAQGVDSNTFSIAGDADVKVSWTIKVLRNDPGCLEDLRRRPVEQLKSEIH